MRIEHPSLLGHSVLVTRPAHQSETLCRLIREAGGIPVQLPAIVIASPPDPELARRQLQKLSGFDMGIFISRNAVEKTLELLHPQVLPPGILWLAVGQATAEALRARGYDVQMPEHDFSSEGLLALTTLQNATRKRIAILRGTGGRELLAATLRARGAAVEYIETYQAGSPPDAAEELRDLLAGLSPENDAGREAARAIDIVVATSTLILENLLTMSGNYRRRLVERPLVVLSDRARTAALAAGFVRVYIAPRNDDPGIMTALQQAVSDGV